MNELITNSDYHSDTSHISKSGLDLIHQHPMYYYDKYLAPDKVPQQEKKHFVVGTISHMAVIEPHYIDRNYFILDARKEAAVLSKIGGLKPRTTNKYKSWLEGEMLNHPGKTMIDVETYDLVCRMRDAIHANCQAEMLLSSGFGEESFTWINEETGAPCKCRPDWVNKNNGWIIDLKFMEDVSPEGFGRAAYSHRYFVQSPFYMDGLAENGIGSRNFFFICAEKSRPYRVEVYYVDLLEMKMGREEYHGDLRTYMNCKETGDWFGTPLIKKLKLPGWAYKKL